jgi:glycolate oxidase FAD binding subunit
MPYHCVAFEMDFSGRETITAEMNKDLALLEKSLASIVDSDFITLNSALKIDALTPALIIKPESAAQASECLKVCAEFDAAVVPAGAMTWLECGNPLRRADVVLSLERLHRVIDYNPPDLMAIVEAGVTLNDFNAITKKEKQWLPLDSAGSVASTLGAIASTATSGSLRGGFGTPRDYVIGLRLAHVDGTESRCGGRVAKNVAGYDLNKLYVGSFGTLAVLTEVNLKLRPMPERFATLLVSAKKTSRLVDLAKRVFASELQPASLFITQALPATANKEALLLRFIESEAAVKYQLDEMAGLLDEDYQATTLSDAEAQKIWQQVTNLDELCSNVVRVSVPLAMVTEVWQKLLKMRGDGFATADIGVGAIRLAFDADVAGAVELIKAMRAEASGAGGALFIERAPTIVRERASAWGDVGNLEALMKGVKQNFDPQSLLNPGRFVAGI